MKVHLLEREQHVQATPEEVFAFFADARNLESIAPPWLGFRVLTPGPIEMRPGALIEYRLWHHTHTFTPRDGGTLVGDRVRYALPLGPLGAVAHRAFVRRDVERIFDFRRAAIEPMLHKVK